VEFMKSKERKGLISIPYVLQKYFFLFFQAGERAEESQGNSNYLMSEKNKLDVDSSSF
jgi:hypothetical protein